jgi:ABC-type multidrug transport system fused ATPase/permease subunit
VHHAGRLLRWLGPYRGAFAAALALGAVASVVDGLTFSLLIPFLRLLFGAGAAFPDAPSVAERLLRAMAGAWIMPAGGVGGLGVVLGLIAAAVAVKNACLYGAGYLGLVVQEGAVRDVRVAVYAHVQRLGLPYFGGTRAGDLAARLVSDADQTRGAIQGLGQAVRSAVLVVVYLLLLVALSWRLALLATTVVLALTLGLRPLLGAVRARWAVAGARRGMLSAVAVETAAAARAVKAAAAERQELGRFTAAADGVRAGVLDAERVALLASPLSESLGAAALLLLLAATDLVGAEGLRPELFVTFVAVALRMLSPMKTVAQFPALVGEALAAADRLFAVLDRPAEEDDARGTRPFAGLHAAIEFRDVWVAYEPGAWVLSGIDLRVARGEVVAIVGPSGAGKSTLVDLLPRFVEPARGVVLVDGVPLHAFGRRSLRSALGIVSQETVLLHESVRANIAYGDRAGASEAEVRAAARAANAAAFIERLPDGYDTVIGERGLRLSGGERQRLAIARALLRDPPILILDEATAHLDADGEREVQEAIARLMAGRTVFVIAHRLATIARANRIVVLEAGRIAETGTHDELVEGGGLYRRLYELQGV